jgi:heme exporter protein B
MPILLREIGGLLAKEMLVEWRQRFALNGLSVYALSLVFVSSLALRDAVTPNFWIVSFWLLVMFIGVNAVAKSFLGEQPGQLRYLYQLAAPEAVVLAKLLYNILLMNSLTYLTAGGYLVLLGNPFPTTGYFLVAVGVGATGLACAMTLISGIVSQAANPATLMAVLSFPVVLPTLLLSIRICKSALVDVLRTQDLLFLALLEGVVVAVSVLLFPYLWKN